MSSPQMMTIFGFCCCCAAAGALTAATAVSDANRPSQMLLVMLMVWLPVDRLIRAGGQCPIRIVTIIPTLFGERSTMQGRIGYGR